MGAKAFISYSHHDEKILDRLHKHLAMLKRDGLIDVWYDRNIEVGGKIDVEIGKAFAESDLFVALISPDFLASQYCYEKEMQAALERDADGSMRVIPIIIEPCDWKSSPLSAFKGLPKDGKPISTWANENVAILDVVNELRRILEKVPVNEAKKKPRQSSNSEATRRYRIKKEFDTIDRAKFRDGAFEKIRRFFEASTAEINQVGDPLKALYELMNPTSFTCTIVNRSLRRGEAHITVHNQKSGSFSDITFTFDAHGSSNTANGTVSVEADDYELFLHFDQFARGDSERNLTADQVAEGMWSDFMARAGIEYD